MPNDQTEDTRIMKAIEEAKGLLAGCLFIPVEKIAADATINAVAEIDSLNFELIVLEIEKRVGHEVDPVRLLELQTVEDLAALLEDG